MKHGLKKRFSGRAASMSPAKIDPKWAWHYRALVALRERLLRERGEKLDDASQPLEPHSMDMADSATDEFDHNMALSELSAEQDAFFEIEEALKRILNGSYGVCEETGKPISPARLRAIPWARFSKDIEDRFEQQGAVNRAQLGQVASVRGPQNRSLEESESPEEESQETTPKDEALAQVYSPPGRHLHPHEGSGKQHKRPSGAGGVE
ncbi:MAG: TraR/DksA family transcriptional regulator [Verrucomicrobia bacterium]|nr:TraR/DksA family transcriptional regulator [Verrucomicrobiota bacterium]